MGILKGWPKLLKWVISTMLVLFLLMLSYRFFFFYSYASPGRSLTGSAIILGMRYDARVVCILGFTMLLLAFIPFLNPFKHSFAKKFWPILLSICWLIIIIFYVADFYHYDYLQDRLNASVLNFFEDAAISFTMMRQTYPVFGMGIFIVVGVLLAWWLNKKLIQKIDSGGSTVPRKRLKWYFIPAMLLMAVLIFGKIGQYPLRWSDAFTLNDDFKSNVSLNPFQSFFSTLKFRHSRYDKAKVEEAFPMMADYFGVPARKGAAPNFSRIVSFIDDGTTAPNIVVVICESFSMYKSSMSGNPLNASPYFNQLASNGLFFERCFTPSLGTARGVWAVITGIPDVEQPTTASRNPANVDQHSIINDLEGYEKFYFLGGSTTWANIRGVLTNNIANLQILEEGSFDAPREDVWGISDKNLFLAANKKFSQQTKPFFSIIQTAGNHRPYTIPDEDLREFKKMDIPADSLTKYGFRTIEEFNAFRYSDYCFQKFMEAASKEKYFSNTIFAFVGDHGVTGDAANVYPAVFTKHFLTAEHVPLLFYAPGKLAPKKISTVSSQLDVMPTVMGIARQSYLNTTLGRNLLDSAQMQKPGVAFISNPTSNLICMVTDDYFYSKSLVTQTKEWASMVNNEAIPVNAQTDSIKRYLENFTEAWYQTSKYLLLNNKKRK
jgi:phosphoglycerol transferase MdoB-like AlkP superfamily enzyme